jgi:putative DNA methylase
MQYSKSKTIKEAFRQLSLQLDSEPINRNLIDIEFDATFADQMALAESFNKHLYRPNTYLHKWWARRCGSTFRAILKHLVRDISHADYYAPGGLEGQIILDPMMGGGTTLHEAIRLGANVIGVDIDPIPVLQARATLSEIDLKQLEIEFASFVKNLRTNLGHLYRSTCPLCKQSYDLRFVLYGVRRRCKCREVIVVDSYTLRHNSDDSVIRICPDSYSVFLNDALISERTFRPHQSLIEKNTECCSCGEKCTDIIDVPYYQRYVPVAVVGECAEHGLFFAAPQQEDIDAMMFADNQRSELGFDSKSFEIVPGPKSSDLVKRGITNYLDVFSSRQLAYLRHAIDSLKDVDSSAQLKLALLISTSLEFNSMLCGYKGAVKSRPGAIRHVFAHHAYSIPYTALENNPLHDSRSSGTLNGLFYGRLLRGARWAQKPIERVIGERGKTKVPVLGELDAGVEVDEFRDLGSRTHRFMVLQQSSASLPFPEDSIDHVVTDPPYFDSVQYGDLAAYFRVWLQQLLPTEADWDYSLDAAAVDHRGNGDGHYESVLGSIFRECHRVLKKESGRLIFTFHHWDPKGWSGLTLALRNAGFVLINRYVIHSENLSSVHIANQNALTHDVVLVLRSRDFGGVPRWTPPSSIDKSSSYDFCVQCGNMLGFMLSSELSDDSIQVKWRQLLSW